MKKIALLLSSTLLILSCEKKGEATPVENQPQAEIQQTDDEPKHQEQIIEEKVDEPEIQPVKEEPKSAPEKKEEPKIQEKPKTEEKKEEAKPEPKIEEKKPEVPVDDEYKRSVGDVDVPKDVFLDDKAAILGIIDELSIIMKEKNYRSWTTYLDKESIDYWSKTKNLKKAQGRLPVKGLQLKTLEDYFKYIFLPARQGRSISEIRYVSDKYTKAVEVKSEKPNDYVVYYYFNKIGGKWMLHLPPLED